MYSLCILTIKWLKSIWTPGNPLFGGFSEAAPVCDGNVCLEPTYCVPCSACVPCFPSPWICPFFSHFLFGTPRVPGDRVEQPTRTSKRNAELHSTPSGRNQELPNFVGLTEGLPQAFSTLAALKGPTRSLPEVGPATGFLRMERKGGDEKEEKRPGELCGRCRFAGFSSWYGCYAQKLVTEAVSGMVAMLKNW